ncbi:glycerol kinase GlpK [Dietzia aurantiaca]|uniref:Glycerol kinase n=1 Tax=Dietzia aurantiaca TaxID=983873 RepID=A0ABV9PMC7_9ACTN|nr:glycerol kinase GlpK [Dietzia aurantiaca]MCD2263139.1 glycerol kinase GlpK [Dietzia aurantiaca]
MSRNTYILAIDQGTTSTRAILFDEKGLPVATATAQIEHSQILPRAGWVEHDPMEIWSNVRTAMGHVAGDADLEPASVRAIGITNQRETVVVWDKATGKPVYNAIVWQDTRTSGICARLAEGHPAGADRFRETTGLPLSTYFAGPKIRWILDHLDERGERGTERAEAGELLAGTMDSWVVWNLTGGRRGDDDGEAALHVTDVTNASRTLLMDLGTMQWSEEICREIGVPLAMLPEIVPSSGVLGRVTRRRMFGGTPISGILGDQQAALFGQTCFEPGDTKNTYGTGAFLLLNTGTTPQTSDNGLLTTVAYQLGDADPVYALEGSVAMAGSLVQWLRDNLGIISTAAETEGLAMSLEDNGDCYLVPAFSGLLAPHWRPDARGALVGLTRFHTKAHMARAALEATAFQTREMVDAMCADAGEAAGSLRVDGGMVGNGYLMQFQADLLGVDVVRPEVTETTALGAAFAAGLAVGTWDSIDRLRELWREDHRWSPEMPEEERERLMARWRDAVERTLGWADAEG